MMLAYATCFGFTQSVPRPWAAFVPAHSIPVSRVDKYHTSVPSTVRVLVCRKHGAT